MSTAAVSLATQGKWSAPFAWPIVAIHLHLLPTGKVLAWGRTGDPQLWDPATGTFTAKPSPAPVFCSGHAFLPDGGLLVTGGSVVHDYGLKTVNRFDAVSQTWTAVAPMSYARWYPTSTTMGDGEVLTISGRDETGAKAPIPEVWKVGGGWRSLSTASNGLPYYPWMFLAPSGKAFYAGPNRDSRYLSTSGTGAWTFLGNSNFGGRLTGSAVMYNNGKVLIVGGGNPPTATAEIINLLAASPAWHYTGSMAYARRQLNVTLLADGKVLVTGGTSGSNGFNDETRPVLAAEIWNPATGTWTTVASMQVPRLYHSTAVLLKDGRVLVAGGGQCRCTDHFDGQIFAPPYLFNSDGTRATRPTISNAPANISYGQMFFVATPNASETAKITWIRLGSVTHAFNQNQRLNYLSFSKTAGGLNVQAPKDRNSSPPGHYLLFVVNREGVPSVARIIRIGS